MGNAITYLFRQCCKPSSDSDGVSTSTASVSALAHDLFNFGNTSQVPEGLSRHVASSKKSQAKWYRKILEAWKAARSPPRTPEEAATLIVQVLFSFQKTEVQGLLIFYGLPLPDTLDVEEVSAEVPVSQPQGVQFELHSIKLIATNVPDGDGLNIYVSTKDPKESSSVPIEVQMAAIKRSKARAKKNYTEADALYKKIVDMGYRVIRDQNEDVLARKCRIRFRGIDAPEIEMPYGEEAKQELIRLVNGKCVKVLVYDEDQYGRYVGDVYCDNVFLQEVMLKKGLAWHYTAYDQRKEFANWEKMARKKRVGLWASSNPEKPWEWRKRNKGI